MISFKLFLESYNQRGYTPKPNDVFYHGSLNDFDPKYAVSDSDIRSGLFYVTRDFRHALKYAEGTRETLGGKFSKNGYIYSYKIDPDANIFNATNKENFKNFTSLKNKEFKLDFDPQYGYSELIQDPNVLNKIMDLGYDGILQKQADVDYYNRRMPKKAKRHEYDKYNDRGSRRVKYRQNMQFGDNYELFSGVTILGIKPSKLIPIKKFKLDDIDFDDLKNRSLYKFK